MSLHWLMVTFDSPQQFHVARVSGVEKLFASMAPFLPPAGPLRVPILAETEGFPWRARGVPIHWTRKTLGGGMYRYMGFTQYSI